MNSKSVNNKLNKDFGAEDQETSHDVENNFPYWIEWTIVDTERSEKKVNKTKIARHVACVQALKGGSPNSAPSPFNACHTGYAARPG